MRRFNVGDTIICINDDKQAFDKGDILTIEGIDGFTYFNELGYVIEGYNYLVLHKDDDEYELYNQELPYQPHEIYDTFDEFMYYLDKNVSKSKYADTLYDLIRFYELFKKERG